MPNIDHYPWAGYPLDFTVQDLYPPVDTTELAKAYDAEYGTDTIAMGDPLEDIAKELPPEDYYDVVYGVTEEELWRAHAEQVDLYHGEDY